MTAKVALADIAPNRRRGGDVRVVLGPQTAGATSGFLGVLALEPGESVSEHYHPYSEEFLYVTRGALTVLLDGEPVELGTDEGLLVPIGVRHRVENRSSAAATAVFQLGPLAPHPSLGHVDTEPLPGADEPHPGIGGPAGCPAGEH